MAEYFVWLRPSLAEIIEAVSEKDAAEAFLEMPVTSTPEPGMPPDCFVQPTNGSTTPRLDGTAVKFWIVPEDELPASPLSTKK